MSVNLHLLQASGRFTPYKDLILDTTEEALQDIKSQIHLPDVDVVLQDFPSGAIPGNPTGGDCYEPHLVRVAIDPTFDNFETHIVDGLRSTLAHELHHAARSSTVGFGDNLKESLITEGLAAHFDIEVNEGEPKPWDVALSDEELDEVKKLAKKEFDNEDYNHQAWFFGSEERGIPKWAGYSIAYSLVGDYLEEIGKSAAEMTDRSAKEFVQ